MSRQVPEVLFKTQTSVTRLWLQRGRPGPGGSLEEHAAMVGRADGGVALRSGSDARRCKAGSIVRNIVRRICRLRGNEERERGGLKEWCLPVATNRASEQG